MVLGAHLREPRVLRQGLLGPARWVTREVLAVTPMVFPTRREAAHNFCYNLCVKGLLPLLLPTNVGAKYTDYNERT